MELCVSSERTSSSSPAATTASSDTMTSPSGEMHTTQCNQSRTNAPNVGINEEFRLHRSLTGAACVCTKTSLKETVPRGATV